MSHADGTGRSVTAAALSTQDMPSAGEAVSGTRPKFAAIIVNPTKVSLDRLRGLVQAEEHRLGWSPSTWYETTPEDPGEGAAGAALRDHPDLILVAGGDGTVRAVAEVVRGSGVPIALLPAGTGNLFARNLGLALGSMEDSLRVAFGVVTRDIDVATADLERSDGARSSHVFLVMAGIGLDAVMAEGTDPVAKRHLGWLAYVDPIARSIIGNLQFAMRYRIDADRSRPTRAHTMIIGNCGTLTANLLLLPGAVLDDGRLDVVLLRPKSVVGWGRIGTRITAHGMLRRSRLGRKIVQLSPDLKALHYRQGRQIEVRFSVPQVIELDGDSSGPVIGARFTAHRGELRVRVDTPAA